MQKTFIDRFNINLPRTTKDQAGYGKLVRKEDIDHIMSVFSVNRLHYVAADGTALLMRDAIDKMNQDTFELYLKYHFATCERMDLIGITSHAIDIFRKPT